MFLSKLRVKKKMILKAICIFLSTRVHTCLVLFKYNKFRALQRKMIILIIIKISWHNRACNTHTRLIKSNYYKQYKKSFSLEIVVVFEKLQKQLAEALFIVTSPTTARQLFVHVNEFDVGVGRELHAIDALQRR